MESYETAPMSGFVQALYAYREGAISRENLLVEVERELAGGQGDAVALLKLLNEEHARARLPDNLHSTIAARILQGQPLTLGGVLQGRFKLLEPVGHGGMSGLYKAIDLRKLEACSSDPHVAIKILAVPASGFGHSLALLHGEVQKLQSLAHPNIVRVMDCDRDGRTVFMTLEYVAGESLKPKLMAPDFKGMPAAEADRIVESIAAALAFAHGHGIVHGDLKPANIIITEKGEVKVIDFGISRLIQRQQPAGSPPNDSTEQRAPDPRDDVYALAWIAHELLTGQQPFDARCPLEARDIGTRLQRHRGVSRSRFRAIAHGLELDRERRTPTVAQFLREFRAARRRSIEPMLLAAGVAALVVIASWYFVFHGRRVGTNAVVPHSGKPVALSSFEIFRDCPTCPLMKVMPRGRFNQGSAADDPDVQPSAQPQHPVAITRPFAIGVYEVTVGEFREFVAATERKITGCTVYDGQWHERTDLGWNDVGFPQTATDPVACVSWRDALDYTVWLSHKSGRRYRLPSASEWEYAARAGSESSRPWNQNTQWACNTANVADLAAGERYPGWRVHPCNDGYVYTAPVGSFHPNAFGLYDLLGNVFEWVQDCWHADYRGSPSNGSAWLTGDCSQHELRGGSWFTSPRYVSVAARNRFAEGYRSNTIGFRLVRELE